MEDDDGEETDTDNTSASTERSFAMETPKERLDSFFNSLGK